MCIMRWCISGLRIRRGCGMRRRMSVHGFDVERSGGAAAGARDDSDLLLVYAPGSAPDRWAAGMAKFIPAGSDLVFQNALHD